MKKKVTQFLMHKHKHKTKHKAKVNYRLIVLISFIIIGLAAIFFKTKVEPEDVSNDIVSMEHMEVTPLDIIYKKVPNFAEIEDITEKKKQFFSYLLPEIRRQNTIVLREREIVLSLSNQFAQSPTLSVRHRQVLDKLAIKYQLEDEESTPALLKELVKRVDIIPPALILVQAANESAWGTSRFAQNGYNFFGLWCFRKGCGFVPTLRGDDEAHEVAKFRNMSHAVMTYIRNLNRHYAYAELRDVRAKLRARNRPITAEALAQGLHSYSIRGQDYIDEILSMIRVNRKYMNLSA
jgi:Bax protein